MAFIWDETTNSWIEKTEEELQGLRDDVEQPIAIGNDPQQDFQRQTAQEQQSALITPNEAAEQSKAKPMFGDLGQSVADIGMIAGNTAVGLGTDVLDLVSYVGDLGRAGVDLMDGGGFNEDDYLFNDADNPWTAWRINTFEQNYNTEAAQMVSNVVRLGSSLMLGGGALKLGGKALGGVARISKLNKLGKPAAAAMGKFGLDEVFKFANKADDGGEGARLMKALNGADDVSEGAKKAVKSARADDWLRRPFADITRDARKVGAAGVADDLDRYASAVKDSVSTVFGLKYKNKLKTFGQMAAWDALATFNVMGEGNADLDETMADWVNSNFGDMQGVPIAGWLMSNTTTLVEDDAIVRKFKGVLDGLILGSVMSVGFDLFRVFRFSKNIRAASGKEQAELLRAFDGQADELGGRIAELRGNLGLDDVEAGYQNLDDLQLQQGMARRTNQDAVAQEAELRFLAEGGDPNSPLQQALGQMPGEQGFARSDLGSSQVDLPPEGVAPRTASDDDLYQQYLRDNYQGDLRSLNPEVQQALGRMQQPQTPGVTPTPGTPGQYPGDVDAYTAWLEANRGPTSVPATATGDAIAPLTPEQAAANQAGQMPPKPPGYEVGPIDGQMQGPPPPSPRLPEPTFRPETIQRSMTGDLRRRIYEQIQRTGGPDAKVLNSEVMNYVNRLLPRTRVDAYEYLVKMKRQFNQGRVLPLADGLLTDAIYSKGFDEGWIKWDPSGEVLVSRGKSVDNDEIDLVTKAGQAMEDADAVADAARAMEPDMAPEPPGYKIQDEGVKVADDEAAVAQQQLDQYQAGENAKVDRMAYMQGMARTYLESENAPLPEVIKAAKGYEVIDETGEVIATARTKSLANKKAKEAQQARRGEMQRQLAERSQGDDFEMISSRQEPVLSDNVKGKVKLTDGQLRDVSDLDPDLAAEIAADAAAGGKVKRTYELSQRQMAELSESIARGLDDGTITGTRAKTLKNLRDKLDTQVKVLSKEASLEKWATKAVDDVIELLANGKICKPLGD
tara:strand:+ start:870 stop:3917 length:3048 start_codon:yes stop_codon:yes gene_type:complete